MSSTPRRESAWSYVVAYGLFFAAAFWFAANAMAAIGHDEHAGWARFAMWIMLALAAVAAPSALARIKPTQPGGE